LHRQQFAGGRCTPGHARFAAAAALGQPREVDEAKSTGFTRDNSAGDSINDLTSAWGVRPPRRAAISAVLL